MEKVACGGHVGYRHVVAGATLQVAFEAGRGVFGALPFVAVGQQHDEAVHAPPLGFAGEDELVNDRRGAVGEVAELGFPDHQRIGIGVSVAVFEAEHGVFRKQGIVNQETARVVGKSVESVDAVVTDGVNGAGMAVAEGAALHVLAAHAHVFAFEQDGAVGQKFAQRPVYLAVLHQRALAVEYFGNLRQRVEILGQFEQMIEQPVECFSGNTGLGRMLKLRVVGGDLQGFPGQFGFLVGVGQFVLAGIVEAGLQVGAKGGLHLLGQCGIHVAALHEAGVVHLARVRVVADHGVHIGLGETRLIAFVVAVLAVAHHVNEHVGIEFLAVLCGQFHGVHHGFGVVAVHVKNGGLHHFGHRGAVGAGAPFVPAGGETDLVIDDKMQGAAGVVARQLTHLDDFVHDTLAGNGGVAVNENGQDVVVLRAVERIGLGAGEAQYHGVHGFEVRGIGQEFEVHVLAVRGFHLGGKPEVVFHVAVAETLVGDIFAFKFGENLFVGFPKGIGQHVQSSAVGHADHDFLYRNFGLHGGADDGIECGNGGLTAFEREAFLAHEFGVQKLLKYHRTVQFFQDAAFFLHGEAEVVGQVSAFHLVAQPVQAFLVVNVRGFEADIGAIDFFQARHNVAQGRIGQSDFGAGGEWAVQIVVAQAVVAQFEVGFAVFAGFDGVGGGQHVPAVAVAVDKGEYGEFAGQVGSGGSACGGTVSVGGSQREIEAFEKGRPVGFHGFRVGLPRSVQGFDVLRMRIKYCGSIFHFLINVKKSSN